MPDEPDDPRPPRQSPEDSIATTGPGIPDEALAPGEDAPPEPPGDAEMEAGRRALGAAPPRPA